MRALFITESDFSDPTTGGVKGSMRNHGLLCEYFDVDVLYVRKRSSLKSAMDALTGYFPPVDGGYVKEARRMMRENKYRLVFLDSSTLGDFMDAVRETDAKCAVYFQNCEHDYLKVRLGGRRSVKRVVYQRAVDRAEGRCAEEADVCIAISKRDEGRIAQLYGRAPEFILPVTPADLYAPGDGNRAENGKAGEKTCLLFGPMDRPNLEGFGWFVKNVSPRLSCRTVVAGRGFEECRRWEAESGGKVSVVGYVDDLAGLYGGADCLALPLLSGAGMKVKTAEAMMFGKYIFGTPEAFAGYQADFGRLGGVCRSAGDFIGQINAFMEEGRDPFNRYARRVYEKRYSMDAGREKFGEIMGSLGFAKSEHDSGME